MKKHQRKDTILRLFEAIQLRGLENLSVLAETAGIPLESARYMVWHELPKHFIAYEVEIDYEALSSRWYFSTFFHVKPHRLSLKL